MLPLGDAVCDGVPVGAAVALGGGVWCVGVDAGGVGVPVGRGVVGANVGAGVDGTEEAVGIGVGVGVGGTVAAGVDVADGAGDVCGVLGTSDGAGVLPGGAVGPCSKYSSGTVKVQVRPSTSNSITLACAAGAMARISARTQLIKTSLFRFINSLPILVCLYKIVGSCIGSCKLNAKKLPWEFMEQNIKQLLEVCSCPLSNAPDAN